MAQRCSSREAMATTFASSPTPQSGRDPIERLHRGGECGSTRRRWGTDVVRSSVLRRRGRRTARLLRGRQRGPAGEQPGARPLDAALLPVYGPTLGPGHMDPGQAAEALTRLRPRLAVPIHWGTVPAVRAVRQPRASPETPGPEFAARAAQLAPRRPGGGARTRRPGGARRALVGQPEFLTLTA